MVEKNGVLESFYLTLIPEKTSKGLLVVLGGFSDPRETLQETDLPKRLVQRVTPLYYRFFTGQTQLTETILFNRGLNY